MGKMRRNDVKYITQVPIRELRTSKIIDSILRNTMEGARYKFIFDVNGRIVERQYLNSFVVGKAFNEIQYGDYNRLGKVFRQDGSWKYALVGYSTKTVTVRRELVSLYVRKIRNPNTGVWEWPGTLYRSEAPDDRLGKMMQFYREDMERVVETKDMSRIKRHFGRMCDYDKLYYFVNSAANKFTSWWWVESLSMGEMPPEDVYEFRSIRVEKPKYCSVPPVGHNKWDGLPPCFMSFVKSQYLKSIYKDVKANVMKKELFYLDDLLMILDMDTEDEDGTPVVVWNSLEATCHGSVGD